MKKGGGGEIIFTICLYFSLLYSDLSGNKSIFPQEKGRKSVSNVAAKLRKRNLYVSPEFFVSVVKS